MPTITFNNQSEGTSYVVLDPYFGTFPIPSNSPTYYKDINLGGFSNISQDNLIIEDYKLSIIVPPGISSFQFVQSTFISAGDIVIRGAGNCSVTYVEGSTTINVTPEELNQFIRTPSPSTGGGYNNIYSFFFNQAALPVRKFFTPRDNTLAPTNNFTISIWAKPYISDPPDDGYLFDNANTNNGFILMHDDFNGPSGPNGRWNFELRKSGQSDLRVRSNISPIANTWQHIAGVFSDGTGSIYVNGVKRGSGSFGSSTEVGVNSSQDVTVGASSQFGTQAFPYSGSLQNLSLWDDAFTQAEIDELYNGGTPTDLNTHTRVSDGIAWWQFGGNGESGSFVGPPPPFRWEELNCFDNSSFLMGGQAVDLGDRVLDTP